jgi:hypothetical protein
MRGQLYQLMVGQGDPPREALDVETDASLESILKSRKRGWIMSVPMYVSVQNG